MQRHHSLLGLAALIVGVAVGICGGCGGHAPTLPSPDVAAPPPPAPGSLVVTVQWQDTHEPVQGATVKVWAPDADPDHDAPVATAQTNAQGKATFGPLPPGQYTVRIYYEDIVEERHPTVPSGGQGQATVLIPREEQPPETGDLRVCVRWAADGGPSEPIEGAPVEVFLLTELTAVRPANGVAPVATGTTGPDGCVTFEDLNPGDYEARTEVDGIEGQGTGTVVASQLTTITIELQRPPGPQPETGNLHVCVRDQEGTPVPGANVELYHMRTRSVRSLTIGESPSKTTGSDGCCTFEDLEPGRYSVYAYTEWGDGSAEADVVAGQTTDVLVTLTEYYYY